MPAEYIHNHYVPQWYQKRFLLPSSKDNMLYLRKLKPETIVDHLGSTHTLFEVRRRSINQCFVQDDLYTLKFGNNNSTFIEKTFFGAIDRNGRTAVEYWHNFTHPSIDYNAFQNMMIFLSTQKLRTPKGLDWLSDISKSTNPQVVLMTMVNLRDLYCAIWTETIWQIADASNSPTKFIISDHPVTVYNRVCGPRNKKWCRGANDPDIRLHGTHTIFPLSLNKVLILTNLSWVRNPYQSAIGLRPNPRMLRGALFKFTDVQTLRELNEREVREINFIIKSRAYNYIAAAKKDWLYPERYVSKSDWNTYGDGYLLMPDPRPANYGGQVIIGYKDGSSAAIDEYGRMPGDPDYGHTIDRRNAKYDPLYRFQGEFARRYGPQRLGRSFNTGKLDNYVDSESMHNYHLGLDARNLN